MNTPSDIKAETLLNYLQDSVASIEVCGTHKRNAYEDILNISESPDGLKCEIARDSIYDILPEALFHPIDRFDNISANESKERFADEYEQQQIEEANARNYFAPFDKYILGLNRVVEKIKELDYSDNVLLISILLDRIQSKYLSNRFIRRLLPYIPQCSKIRGNRTLISLILRRILYDEHIELVPSEVNTVFNDISPRYSCSVPDKDVSDSELYLGSVYEEGVLEYNVRYWDEDECTADFLTFVEEIKTFESFINDFFIGIESSLKFNIFTIGLSTRLSDEFHYNYLDYNTNL